MSPVKSETEIRRRLNKLRTRYLNKHVQETQRRFHKNCVYNQAHQPKALPYPSSPEFEFERAPRKNRTLVVLQESPKAIRLCMYGSESSETWSGDICDSDSVSASCPMFRPHVSSHEAALEFEHALSDDETVLKSFPDIAALQWVLDDRTFSRPALHRAATAVLSFFLSVFAYFRRLAARGRPPLDPSLPPGFWDDSPPSP